MKHKTEHLNSKGVSCPYCKSYEIEGGPVEIQEGLAFQEVSCTSCEGAWQDKYTLIDTLKISEPKSSDRLLMLDVDATDLFANESPDWRYCVENASFSHREACEFIIHIGMDDDETFEERLREMHAYDECSEDFLELMRIARQQKAVWLMLHA